MRRAAWLVLIGAVCLGCAKKAEVVVPNVAIESEGPRGGAFNTPQPPTFELPYGKMWDPKGAEKVDPAVAVKKFLAERHFAKHHAEFLAPATLGSFVSLAQGGFHGVAAPVALASAYPEVAKKLEGEGKDRLVLTGTNFGTAALDFSTSGGSVSTRVLSIRVKDGTDDELRIRFGEYLGRLEDAVKGAGVALTVHQRGGLRTTGALSDIRYESPTNSGFVRSVVVRKCDDADVEFAQMILGDAVKGEEASLFKAGMRAERGPYLVVALRNERR